ncbi:hypothetical protein [Pimelobacter simplex]|uniref:hypothetical protein n=1 Tax=Nocardioides simplex TaxID=2045 RepID=UPI00214FC73A|nr:hypothetical protein [Pimelobacter simplex]UUW88455.1 hypothetical protein M0M43_22310 [Pimelobacter simplex]UUW97959.1 hypothetical protein M0M48_10955 [Pimelobacter simplex]
MNRNQQHRDTIVVICLLATAGTMIFAVIGRDWARSEREDVAQWIMAAASVVTLVAALVAAWFAGSAYRIEAAREDRLLEDARKSQASRVAAWLGTVEVDVLVPGPSGTPNRTRTHNRDVILIRNASDLPVTTVTLWIHFEDVGISAEFVPLVPPASAPYVHRLSEDTRSAWGEAIEMYHDANTPTLVPPTLTIDISFTDAAGRRWTRRADGELS